MQVITIYEVDCQYPLSDGAYRSSDYFHTREAAMRHIQEAEEYRKTYFPENRNAYTINEHQADFDPSRPTRAVIQRDVMLNDSYVTSVP